MRLDHLLSREFFILLRVVRCSALPAPLLVWGGGWGWSGRVRWGYFGCEHEERVRVPPGCPGGRGCLSPVPPLFDGGGWVVGGMLSGSGAVRPGCGPARRAGPFFVWGVGLACVGGLVVICIVDASIFVLCVVIVVVFVWVVLCVCFFGRSVDALASGADEGRGGLR